MEISHGRLSGSCCQLPGTITRLMWTPHILEQSDQSAIHDRNCLIKIYVYTNLSTFNTRVLHTTPVLNRYTSVGRLQSGINPIKSLIICVQSFQWVLFAFFFDVSKMASHYYTECDHEGTFHSQAKKRYSFANLIKKYF